MPEFEVRPCRKEASHQPHFWGDALTGDVPYRCPGLDWQFFYLDWERQVRAFHPPRKEHVEAARTFLQALDTWEEMPDTAGSRWALRFIHWLADYKPPD